MDTETDTKNLPGSWRRPTSSLQKFELRENPRLEALTTAAKRLFSQFRVDATVEPRTYLVAVIAVFEHYADDVVTAVTHPFTGMASKQNWLPTIFEIRQACDAARAADNAAARRERDLAAQFARRKSIKEETTQEERAAHVKRVGARRESPDDDLGLAWFDRLSVAEANEILARYEHAVTPLPSPPADFDIWGPGVPAEDEGVPF